MTEVSELLPCPFCGGEARLVRMMMDLDDPGEGGRFARGVWCEPDLEDGCSHGHFVDNYGTAEAAVEAWNRAAKPRKAWTLQVTSDVDDIGEWYMPSLVFLSRKAAEEEAGRRTYTDDCSHHWCDVQECTVVWEDE